MVEDLGVLTVYPSKTTQTTTLDPNPQKWIVENLPKIVFNRLRLPEKMMWLAITILSHGHGANTTAVKSVVDFQ